MKKILMILFAVLMLMSACVTNSENVASSGIKQATSPELKNSVEQDNIKARLQIMNSPTATLWFYGLSDTGSIIFKSAVQGKVTSSGKRLEPTTVQQNTANCGSYYYRHDDRGGTYSECSSEVIQDDGTFGHSDEYVYWFDFENNYFQWNGKYILTTKPLKINVPVIEFQVEK